MLLHIIDEFGNERALKAGDLAGGSVNLAWGSITGTITNQTDLVSALAGKSDASHSHAGVYESANANIQSHVLSAHAPSGATVNQTDAFLLNRANHTGTQAVGTITGLGTLATQNGTFSGSSSGTNTGDQTAIPNSNLATMLTKTYKGRTSATTGTPEDVSVAALKTDLGLVKADVGLANVDNTSDVNKPVSTDQSTAINLKKTDSMNTNKLLGRGTAGIGVIEEITLGTNLSLTGTTLNASGAGGASWGTITGTLSSQTDLNTALSGKSDTGHTHAGTYEPANANIQAHVISAHAPSNAQANADITKAEIEAKLTGVISSHSHSGGGSDPWTTIISSR